MVVLDFDDFMAVENHLIDRLRQAEIDAPSATGKFFCSRCGVNKVDLIGMCQPCAIYLELDSLELRDEG